MLAGPATGPGTKRTAQRTAGSRTGLTDPDGAEVLNDLIGLIPADDREEPLSYRAGIAYLAQAAAGHSQWPQLSMAGHRAALGLRGSRLPGRLCEAAGPRQR